jgi:hypothetical protein
MAHPPPTPPTALPAPDTPCPNCGAALAEPRPRYCPACGQETHIKPPTLGEFMQQFSGAYLSTEGALWRTLRLLLLRPGELTRQYLAGRRKHYVLPLRLYLTISVVTLLLVRAAGTVGTVNIDVEPPAAGAKRNLTIKIGNGSTGLRDGVFYCEQLPDWVCARVQRRIDLDGRALQHEIEQSKDRFLGNLGGAMFVLLPGFALWLKLVYLNRGLRYTEHLVFALHVHAFWFVALALTLPNRLWLSVPAFAAVPWYTLLAMKRVYGGRRGPRLLRALVVSTLYGVTLALAVTGVGLWTLLS